MSITTPPDRRPTDPTPDDLPFAGIPEADPVVEPEAHPIGGMPPTGRAPPPPGWR